MSGSWLACKLQALVYKYVQATILHCRCTHFMHIVVIKSLHIPLVDFRWKLHHQNPLKKMINYVHKGNIYQVPELYSRTIGS